MENRKCKNQIDLYEIWYSKVLRLADFDFGGRISTV